ncbi:MAG: thrombospondin type 3 repeat-containing protein [Fibrobacterales bacterium]
MYSVNKLSVLAVVLWGIVGCGSNDIDLDGIPNEVDECPKISEDRDNFEDNDGCPDPDNDRDKVADSKDKCPLVAEDLDGFEDDDGCPDTDNDKDGMPDSRDKCPLVAEDRDNFEDTDGCPELDNDQDGILDINDKCPLDKEDRDEFQDDDGCPEDDNDNDGIKDVFDNCPNAPENFNGKDDDDGCPDAGADPIPTETYLDISFITGTPELTFNDKIILDNQLVTGLKAYPHHKIFIYIYMKKIEIELPEYIELLNDRTTAIVEYLVEQGVNKENQIRVRTVTEELYESLKDSEDDYNQIKKLKIIRR